MSPRYRIVKNIDGAENPLPLTDWCVTPQAAWLRAVATARNGYLGRQGLVVEEEGARS